MTQRKSLGLPKDINNIKVRFSGTVQETNDRLSYMQFAVSWNIVKQCTLHYMSTSADDTSLSPVKS